VTVFASPPVQVRKGNEMLLQLSEEQELFRRTTAQFLENHVPVAELRRLRDHAVGVPGDYWRLGTELGWTSLLASEQDGGVSISDRGLVDLTLAAYEFGRHAAPGPLASANVVVSALSAAKGGHELIPALLDGSAIATWCLSEGAPREGLDVGLEIDTSGGELVLNGQKRPVESAGIASHLLVTGRTGKGLTQVLVPRATRGVSVTPMRGVDLTRRFSVVTFDNVRVPASTLVGEIGHADAQVERQLQYVLVLLCAEAVGAMQAAFDMTLEWAFDRYSFGRPLASYQALKHRFAHMAVWLQASHAICDEAAHAVATEAPDAAELASAAKAYIGDYGTELCQECVQLHGGIGVTFEHDLHLFLRRVTLARTLFGTPDQHRRRLAGLLAKNGVAS
jgi:alkylation response protein AidB-like acyl-CoA dehydrogenase